MIVVVDVRVGQLSVEECLLAMVKRINLSSGYCCSVWCCGWIVRSRWVTQGDDRAGVCSGLYTNNWCRTGQELMTSL